MGGEALMVLTNTSCFLDLYLACRSFKGSSTCNVVASLPVHGERLSKYGVSYRTNRTVHISGGSFVFEVS